MMDVGHYLEVWDSMDFRVTHFLRKLVDVYVRTRTNNGRRRVLASYSYAMILPPPDIDQGGTYYLSIEREAIIWFIDMLFDYWDSKSFLCWSRHNNSKAMYGFIKWRMKKWPPFAWNNSLILLSNTLHWNVKISIWIRISRASIR